MLIEFYQIAKKAIAKHQPMLEYQIGSDTMLYVNKEQINDDLQASLDRLNFSFAIDPEENGLTQLLQMNLPYRPNCYGYIPEGLLEQLEQEI